MASNSCLALSGLAFRRTTEAKRWQVRAAAVLLGSSLLWVSAKMQVPFWPVPITMQTYVVLTLGAFFGWRLGAATVGAYLAEGVLGLPVFAGTPANGTGLAYIVGPTGGYLAGYLVAVVLVGILIESRWNRSILSTAAALLIGELIILILGCSWLALQTGWDGAAALGLGPFLLGDGVKLVLAVATAAGSRKKMPSFARKWRTRQDSNLWPLPSEGNALSS